MLSRWRLLFVWLVAAAIPLQGVAAASMLFCGIGAPHATVQVAAGQQEQTRGVTNQRAAHDHAKHGHAAQGKVDKTPDSGNSKLPDGAHKCGVCGSCCHTVAIIEFPPLVAVAPVPQAALAEPFAPIHARPSQVPDKPPRA